MPMMQWNNSLSVGVDAMDTQHKKLIDLTNKLFDAMKVGKGKEALTGILSELVSYTKVHFSAEEKLMQNHNYPAINEHKQRHQQLLTKVGDFCNKYKAGDIGISISLCNFLQDWLKVHISEEDKAYGRHVASQTVSVG